MVLELTNLRNWSPSFVGVVANVDREDGRRIPARPECHTCLTMYMSNSVDRLWTQEEISQTVENGRQGSQKECTVA